MLVIMRNMTKCGLALALAVASAIGAARAQAVKPPPNRAMLANWGISGRVVSGKIPILNITIEQDKVLAAWPQIQAVGLVKEPEGASWPQKHQVTICKDVALVAAPIILHDLYREDDALDYAPVYVFLDSAASEDSPDLMFTVNVNRAIVRKLSAAPDKPDPELRVSYSPWLEAHLQQEQP